MSNYTNNDIKLTLGQLSSDLRNGVVTITGGLLRNAIAQRFGISPDAFNTENFNPQTLKRFATLFDVPKTPLLTEKITGWKYPTQDQYAWALRNFINRRANPWSHVTPTPVSLTQGEGLGLPVTVS